MNINYVLLILMNLSICNFVLSGNTYDPQPNINVDHSSQGYKFTIDANKPPQYSFFKLLPKISNENNTLCSNKWIENNVNGKAYYILDITFSEIEYCQPKETVTNTLITQELDLILTLYDTNVNTDFKNYYWRWYNYIDRSTMISTDVKMLANEVHLVDIDVNSTITSDIKFCKDLTCITEYRGNFYHGQEIILSHFFLSNLHKYINPSHVWLTTTTGSILDLSHTIDIVEKSINKCIFKVRLSTCIDCTLYIKSIIHNSINRFRRLNNSSLFVDIINISVLHNSSKIVTIYDPELENSIKNLNIVIIILSIILTLQILYYVYSKINKNKNKNKNKNGITPLDVKLIKNLKTVSEKNVTNEFHSRANSATYLIGRPKLRRIKSDSEISLYGSSNTNSNTNSNNMRDTISEPLSLDDYKDRKLSPILIKK